MSSKVKSTVCLEGYKITRDGRCVKDKKYNTFFSAEPSVLKTKFVYIKKYNNPRENLKVNKVIFDISRYGMHEKEIEFKKPKTVDDAIKSVEDYLSKKVTKKYFEDIKDDLFYKNNSFKDYENRGELLSDANFLEQLKFTTSNGVVTMRLITGS